MSNVHAVRPIHRRGRWLALPVVGGLVLTGTLTATAQPLAHQAVTGIPGVLVSVSAVSAADAWAVGFAGNPTKPLIMHWDGTKWSSVQGPSPSSSELDGVSMVSATDGWAVGTCFSCSDGELIEHWNGTKWSPVTSASPNAGNSLRAVSMVSATDGWAVGYRTTTSDSERPLTLRWNGTRWSPVPVPAFKAYTALFGVSAASASDAWAVGDTSEGELTVLTLHWNGTSWARVPIAHPAFSGAGGVSDASPGDVWAVGATGKTLHNTPMKTLTLRWNGAAWQHIPSPSPGQPCPPCTSSPNYLSGVAIVAKSNAWSVGDYLTGVGGPPAALILHWNGTRWARVPAHGGTTGSFLEGITMVSAANGWAVGAEQPSPGTDKTLILHWNGTTWSRS